MGISLMSADHNRLERNSLDVFTGFGNCLESPVCGLHLSSDRTGDHHGWYCDYVEVFSVSSKSFNKPCNTHHFTIQQWLATDVYPYQLVAHRDECSRVKKSIGRKVSA
ncbi:hypothetical protein MPTK1_5g19864 [Marchantia polymorpha subsp. ruderalis]|uniref:PLAT domain-containing protein n=2 Tax=Marchantia polymorpha TaxID=3197 RepID=A0A679DXT5_MARPO|nr:hypothetical protein MARPO_0134s0046 [Marchantia polymorpha]BBN20697.1 hypothetical protein Mp_zg00280 [Marchantia polymorpha subsp. ruderalis]|eukprot:PTQ29838.1 hypothetical protein MARPO_0134s0046 [Marchantia polymorpha]